MYGNCPYCNGVMTSLHVNSVNAIEDSGRTWKSATFTCPFCRKVIGAAFDQTVHSDWVVNEIVKRLRQDS